MDASPSSSRAGTFVAEHKGLTSPFPIKFSAYLPSVATWLSYRVVKKALWEGSGFQTECVTALGSRGFLQAASMDVVSRESCETCDVLDTFSVHSASTAGGAANRTNRRAHLRKAAKNRIKRVEQESSRSVAEEGGERQITESITKSDFESITASTLESSVPDETCDIGIQCNLGREDLQKLDLEWRNKYELMRKELNHMKLRLLANSMGTEAAKVDDMDRSESSEDSWVCGFSDYGDGGGRGTKIVLGGLPEGWTRQQIGMLLERSGLPVPNFIGVRGPNAAVFFDQAPQAQHVVDSLHFTVIENRVLKVKIEEDRDAEIDDASSISEEFDKSVEVGDIARVRGLLSDAGRPYNGRYGKVTSWDDKTGRFGISIEGKTLAVKPENLEIGSADLVPQDIQDLPWLQRVKRMGLLGGHAGASSSGFNNGFRS